MKQVHKGRVAAVVILVVVSLGLVWGLLQTYFGLEESPFIGGGLAAGGVIIAIVVVNKLASSDGSWFKKEDRQ